MFVVSTLTKKLITERSVIHRHHALFSATKLCLHDLDSVNLRSTRETARTYTSSQEPCGYTLPRKLWKRRCVKCGLPQYRCETCCPYRSYEPYQINSLHRREHDNEVLC